MIAATFGGGVAPWISGLLRDQTGNYALSLTCAAAAFALAIVFGWLLPRQGHVICLRSRQRRSRRTRMSACARGHPAVPAQSAGDARMTG